jgi:hypothetical protein
MLFYTHACPPPRFAGGHRRQTLGFAVPSHHSRTTFRPQPSRLLRHVLFASLVAAAAISSAQQQDEEPEKASWLDGVRAQCAEQYSADQCADPDFLNANFHVDSLQAAHRTAIKRRGEEDRALRELLMQRACNSKKAYCEQNPGTGCAEQLKLMCTAFEQQVKRCLVQAKLYCTAYAAESGCTRERQAQCPAIKRQSVDKLLEKYPKLSAQQQENVRATAGKLDKNLGGSWITDMFRRLF